MKLKTWLLSSYLIVMILPLILAYLLFASINDYNEDQKVKAFFTTTAEMKKIQKFLDNPSLYKRSAAHSEIDALVSDKLLIQLHNPNGLVLYSSNPVQPMSHTWNRKVMYKDLYTLKQDFRLHRYKAPVFDKSKLVGFYEIELARDSWVQEVSNRTTWTIVIFVVLFLLIYIVAALFINRKVNRRLVGLKEEMTDFANGRRPVKENVTNEDEIGQLQRHFYDMQRKMIEARELIEKDQLEREYMIATISHDLKTPLTSIRAYAESLELNEKLTKQEESEYRQVIIEKSNFMKQMLDDLLTFTLLQSPSYEMKLTKVDGSEFFDMLVSDYDPLCEEKGIQHNVTAEVTGVYAVNPKQIIRVVDNLMSNAIHHTEKGGHIWLAALSEYQVDWLFNFVKVGYDFDCEKNMYIIVQNEGGGIAKHKLENIFDPLYQADEARSKKDTHGTGLGLSIAKQMVEKHHGTVQVFSEESIGTCVICALPK